MGVVARRSNSSRKGCHRQDVRQAGVGCDEHGRVLAQAAAALLPDHAGVISGQQLTFRRHEGPAVLRRVAQGADGPAGSLVGVGQYQREKGPLPAGKMLYATQPVAQVETGQSRSLADDADGASSRQGEQQVVGAVAVVVHPHGVPARVGVGDHGGDAVEHGDGVPVSASRRNHCFETG